MDPASPLAEGERIEVRGCLNGSVGRNPHPALSLGKGEAKMDGTAPERRNDFRRVAPRRAKERWPSDEGVTNFSFEILLERVDSDQ